MKYPFFASFLVLCALFYYKRKKADRTEANIMAEYYERENRANNTRKQPVDNLDYINIPLEQLPMELCKDDELIAEYHQDITRLLAEKIVNFTGQTNTDLKLLYGPANLPFLQQCDFNYTHLVTVLHNWAKRLYDLQYTDAALTVLEYAVSIKADISGVYFLAADIYVNNNTPEKINALIAAAEGLESVMKNSIINKLNEKIKNGD